MTAAERRRYALQLTRDSLRGGDRSAFQYGGATPAGTVTVPAEPLQARLRQAPRVLRAALAAINEENRRRSE